MVRISLKLEKFFKRCGINLEAENVHRNVHHYPMAMSVSRTGGRPKLANRIAGFSQASSSGLIVGGSALIDERYEEVAFDQVMLHSASAMTPAAKPVQIEVRKEFPETWLFESFDFNSRFVFKLNITQFYIKIFQIAPAASLYRRKFPTRSLLGSSPVFRSTL